MAAKIKEGLRDITQGVVERLKGGPKYADNLLGESLQDQLRKATGRELLEPNEELTSQVVDTINQDIANGKDSKDIVGLLKKRLRNDNPHKQWLTVLLVGRVMRDCAAALGTHQEELLQEVARVMARPAKQDSSAGKTTRQAAKDLLRSYGRAGTSAFRAASNVLRTTQQRSAAEAVPQSADYAAAVNAAIAQEAAIVVEEVKSLIEQAQANTELLGEMLVAAQGQGAQSGGPGPSSGQAAGDDFEKELTRELVTEVRELRTLFDAYLEQLQSMSGEPSVDEIMIKALEAVDLLDGALALQQDVASNQAVSGEKKGLGGQGSGSTAGDLIMLDDEDLLPQPPPVLDGDPIVTTVAAAAKAAAVAAAVAEARSSLIDPFEDLDPVAIQATLSPSSTQPQPPVPTAQSAAATTSEQTLFTGTHSTPSFQQQQPQQQYAYPSQPQPQQQYSMYGTTISVTPSAAAYPGVSPSSSNTNNPFTAPAMSMLPVATATILPAGWEGNGNPFDQVATTCGTAVGNPFAPPAAPSFGSGDINTTNNNNNTSVMDSEWAMFFANRTAGAAGAAAAQH